MGRCQPFPIACYDDKRFFSERLTLTTSLSHQAQRSHVFLAHVRLHSNVYGPIALPSGTHGLQMSSEIGTPLSQTGF